MHRIPPRRCCAIGGRPRPRCTAVLLDRFRRNLRRAAGRSVQYFRRVEPQRRLAPHARFAMRGFVEVGEPEWHTAIELPSNGASVWCLGLRTIPAPAALQPAAGRRRVERPAVTATAAVGLPHTT